jgi:hypothetical protein
MASSSIFASNEEAEKMPLAEQKLLACGVFAEETSRVY